VDCQGGDRRGQQARCYDPRAMVPPICWTGTATLLPSRAIAHCLVLGGLLLVGCTTTPIPPADTAEALQARCVRTGGWWRPNMLEGFCEYQLPLP
jgi:hypothetical protein